MCREEREEENGRDRKKGKLPIQAGMGRFTVYTAKAAMMLKIGEECQERRQVSLHPSLI